jgi:hypothetical protein
MLSKHYIYYIVEMRIWCIKIGIVLFLYYTYDPITHIDTYLKIKKNGSMCEPHLSTCLESALDTVESWEVYLLLYNIALKYNNLIYVE